MTDQEFWGLGVSCIAVLNRSGVDLASMTCEPRFEGGSPALVTSSGNFYLLCLLCGTPG